MFNLYMDSKGWAHTILEMRLSALGKPEPKAADGVSCSPAKSEGRGTLSRHGDRKNFVLLNHFFF